MKILLAEDDELTQEKLKSLLETCGHEVVTANDGAEAWKAFDQEPVRIIVSDWMMPQMDGLTLWQEARQKPGVDYTYFILLTGQSGDQNYQHAMKAGVDDFLTKPVRKNELLSRLRVAERIFDFTAQIRKLEESLQRSQKMESIGQLAGGVAHDFNNIMAVVLGYSSLLLKEDGAVDGSARKKIEAIQTATQKGAQIIKHLLAFSRHQLLQPRLIDLNIHLQMFVDVIRHLINENIELVTHFSDEKITIKVDPNYLEQVIMNLVVNARDAMPNGGKLILKTSCVEIEANPASNIPFLKPGPYVMLLVKDTGMGMTTEVLARAFEPFFTTKTVGKGSGLGLSTAYGIIKQSGGYIDLQSQPEDGTMITIYFPRLKVELIEEKNHEEEVQELPQGSETILVVEDEESVRNMVRELLTGLGYQVLEACDGQEALELCKQTSDPIHLIFTDVVMPRINGIQLAKQLQLIRPEIKILFASGYADQANLEFGLLDPEVNFLAKPYEFSTLAKKVRCMLDATFLNRR